MNNLAYGWELISTFSSCWNNLGQIGFLRGKYIFVDSRHGQGRLIIARRYVIDH